MLPVISDTCMFLGSTKGIWDAIRQIYLKYMALLKFTKLKQKFLQPSKGINLSQNTQLLARFMARDGSLSIHSNEL